MKYGKKIFKILSKIDVPGANCINFHLSSIVHYRGGNSSRSLMICTRSYPFNTWKAGDYLEADLDRICYELGDNVVIYDASMVRILDEQVTEEIRKSQIELYELKNTKDKLIPIVNNFSQKIINKNFFDFFCGEFLFNELSLSLWRTMLDSMINEFDRLKRGNDDLQREKDNLWIERNELRTKFNKKNTENESNKDKLDKEKRERQNDKTQFNNETTRYNNERLEWTKKEGQKNAEIAGLKQKSNNSETQKTKLEKELEEKKKEVREKDNENNKLLIKLDEKTVKIQDLNNQLTNLQLESGKKNKEIERLKKWAELSQEELLKEKLRSERENLDFFAAELKINLEQIHSLSKYHERLFQAQKKHNQANIETHESNIVRAKQELLEKKKISIVNIQEIGRKCERIAQFRWELEQTQQRQIQMNDWKNINSNFTPELVQEWINHEFTYEQCRDWINTTSPWQQNRAIKEPVYYAWLRDIKKVNTEWVLNNGNEQELGQEFFQWYQEQYQVQQEQPTK